MVARAGWFRVLQGSVGAVFAGLVFVGTGCAADSSSGTTEVGYASGGGSSGSSGPSTQPMLVIVDTNQTMNAAPGQGVGVFVQYQSGGNWNVWWTCDTDKTALPCNFAVSVSVATGTIDNLAGESIAPGDTLNQASPQQVEAVTTTSTGVSGMTFETPLGATPPVITLAANVDGAESGSFLFFVQDGKINGGYTGMLTDPLKFEPSSP
jgi:hypothetical protein